MATDPQEVLRCSSGWDGRLGQSRSSCPCHSAGWKADNCHKLISRVAEYGCVRDPLPGELTTPDHSSQRITIEGPWFTVGP